MDMLAITSSQSQSSQSTAHLLPCRIHHDGKVSTNAQMWKPEIAVDATSTDSKPLQESAVTHFRGRKLLGKVVNVPEGYHGAALCITENRLTDSHQSDQDCNDASFAKVAEQVAEFDKFIIWRHESLPEATDDAYLKGIEEWMELAETIHSS